MQEKNLWTDPSYLNVGYLIEDNKPTLDGEPLYVDPESVGLIGEIKTIRKKGQMVIIDLDYVFDFNDPDVEIGRAITFNQCCKRYENEKKTEKNRVDKKNNRSRKNIKNLNATGKENNRVSFEDFQKKLKKLLDKDKKRKVLKKADKEYEER